MKDRITTVTGKAKAMNNHVMIDLGHATEATESYRIGNIVMLIDTTYRAYDYLRRSGVVMSTPERLHYHRGVDLRYRLRFPQVKQGDRVFFDAGAHEYCKNEGKVFRSDEGNRILLMPYHYLICTLKEDGSVQMHNGNVIVKSRPDLSSKNSTILYIPDHLKKESYSWVEVVHIDSNEGFEAVNILAKKRWDYISDDEISVGDEILINRFSDFDLQGIISEAELDDKTEPYKKVHRESIIAVRKPSGNIYPCGFFAMVKADEVNRITKSGLIIPNTKRIRPLKGVIEDIGSGCDGIFINQVVRFKDKDCVSFDGHLFVHKEWILLTDC